MSKSELIKALSEKTGLKKVEANAFVEAFVETVQEELVKGGDVTLVGFGKFSVRERAERVGRNPQTDEKLVIPAHKVPVFKAGKLLKDSVK